MNKQEAERIAADEEWRPLPGYERTYRISSYGRVWSIARECTPGGIRKQRLDRNGYPFVDLNQDGGQNRFRIHILVALAFIGPRPEGSHIRHLDGNPSNPTPSNLAYGSAGQNLRDTVAHGRHFWANKTHCPSGHEYTPENTLVSSGRRYCRACKRARGRR